MEQNLIELLDFSLKYVGKFASYAEARFESTNASDFVIKNGILEASSSSSFHGLGMRFLINGSQGCFSTNNLRKQTVKKLADESIRTTAAASKISEKIDFSDEKTFVKKYSVHQKIKIENFGTDKKISALKEADDAIKKIASERYLSLSDSLTEKFFANTNGSRIFSAIPKIGFYYNFSVLHSSKSAQRSWLYGSSSGYEILKKWNMPQLLLREAKALEQNLKFGIKPPKGKVDVVCAPEVVAIMVHESVGHPYEADRILGREAAQAGESFVTKEMLNSRIGNECVNVADDPTLENSFGYYLFDDEGVKAGKRLLIKNGMINEFLHNRQTAKIFGTKSNAAARALNYSLEPIVRMANTFMVPGEYSEEELVEDVKHGIYIKNFMEWNIDDIRLNQKYVGAEAYLIKNGKVLYSKPVIKPTIEITTPKLYSSIDAVGNKKTLEFHSGTCGKGEPMQAIPVWFGGPCLRIKSIEVSSKKEQNKKECK